MKLVISDVDGTITKSDVLGHVAPRVGIDWSHGGVTSLYSRIASNGYQMVYLTARGIGLAADTREYLNSVRQGSNGEDSRLPAGCVPLPHACRSMCMCMLLHVHAAPCACAPPPPLT